MSDIYGTSKRLDSVISRIKNSEDISDKDRNLILSFKDEAFSQGLSDKRVKWYLKHFNKLAEWTNGNLEDLGKGKIKNLVAKIERSQLKDKDWSEWTKHGYKVCLKKLYQFISEYEWKSKKYPDKVDWISTNIKNSRKDLPTILTKDEVKEIIRAASKTRNKALISVLYESGARVGELLDMKIKDILKYDEYGAKVRLKGKTGTRDIRLVSSVPHLKTWLEQHPNNSNGSYLWVSLGQKNHSGQLSYRTVNKLIKDLVSKAKIDKKVTPHTFRHSRATHMAAAGINNAVMCEYFGWVQGSDMPQTYFHLSGKDVDKAVLQMYGFEEEEEGEKFEKTKCQRCGHMNGPEMEYCEKCDLPLTQSAMIETEEKKKESMEEMVKGMIEQRFEEMKD